jgi:nucleotide-binding universal stress UspA family protein
MIRFKHILVPVDFEQSSRDALDVAVDLALTFDSKLTLLHSWESVAYAYATLPYVSADLSIAIEQAAKDQLETLRARVAERLPRVEVTLTRGPPAFDIVAVAERLKADLIVMGTHGRRGMSHVLLGSVAEKVVRCSPIPVLTIRGGAPVASKVSLRPAHAPA